MKCDSCHILQPFYTRWKLFTFVDIAQWFLLQFVRIDRYIVAVRYRREDHCCILHSRSGNKITTPYFGLSSSTRHDWLKLFEELTDCPSLFVAQPHHWPSDKVTYTFDHSKSFPFQYWQLTNHAPSQYITITIADAIHTQYHQHTSSKWLYRGNPFLDTSKLRNSTRFWTRDSHWYEQPTLSLSWHPRPFIIPPRKNSRVISFILLDYLIATSSGSMSWAVPSWIITTFPIGTRLHVRCSFAIYGRPRDSGNHLLTLECLEPGGC